jgi:hypothetical protein
MGRESKKKQEEKAALKAKLDSTRLKKESFLKAFIKTFGNITISCESLGISRQTYYDWKKDDPAFAKALAEVEPDERFLDSAELALNKKIMDGDTTAIIFALKTKGKKRGYIERTENINYEKPSPFEDMTLEEKEAELKRLSELDGK